MKQPLLFLLAVTSLSACNNKAEDKNAETLVKADTIVKTISQKPDSVDNPELAAIAAERENSLKAEFKNFKIYTITDTIKADFNGDKIFDLAYFTHDNKKEIYIIDGKTKTATKVGLDKSFGDMGTDFDWVDFWGTINDPETYDAVVKDDEVVGARKAKLKNISLFVRRDEVGGGVITFKNGKYIWVHQSD
ncbi:MAG: hypothetical protein WDN26_05020 [Chitinophagaceae bacterium]